FPRPVARSGRSGRRLARLAGAELLHRLPDLHRGAFAQVDLLADGPVSLQVERDLVPAGRGMEALEGAVEVVHDAGPVAVDVDLGVPGGDEQAGLRARLEPGRVRPVVSVGPVNAVRVSPPVAPA